MFTGIVQGVGEIIAIREPSADFRTHIVKSAHPSPTTAAA